LARLDSPQRIQAFLNAIQSTTNSKAETVHFGPQRAAQSPGALHEGAFVRGLRALDPRANRRTLMHLDCRLKQDYPH